MLSTKLYPGNQRRVITSFLFIFFVIRKFFCWLHLSSVHRYLPGYRPLWQLFPYICFLYLTCLIFQLSHLLLSTVPTVCPDVLCCLVLRAHTNIPFLSTLLKPLCYHLKACLLNMHMHQRAQVTEERVIISKFCFTVQMFINLEDTQN